MNHKMKLNSVEFFNIKNEIKDIEVRVNDEKRKLIKIGDFIEFVNIEDYTKKICVEVSNITKFHKFDDLYDYYPIERFGSVSKSKEDLINKIYKIYSKKEEELGVIAIEIKLYN